jgi:hypothetical protein
VALQAYEVLAAEPLVFPIGGKLYTLAPLGIKTGMRLAGVIAGDDKSLNDLPAQELWRIVLGPLWDELLADDVPSEAVARAGMAAMADFQYGRAVAVAMWETGDSPEALAARVAASKATSNPSTSSESGGKTPSQASTSRTKSRPGTPRAAKKTTVSRSPGKASSSSGS